METFSLERSGANLILHISEELDHHTAGQLSRTIDVLIEKGNVKNIVFDFDGMTFMDSSGIGMVMGRYKKMGATSMLPVWEKELTAFFRCPGCIRLFKKCKDGGLELKMSGKNEIIMEFSSNSENESLARTVISAFVARLDPTLEELADIKTAVSEAVTNAIIHGYEKNPGMVRMAAKIEDNVVSVEISDTGAGIENLEKAMEPMYTTKPELDRSGMGFAFMEAFMDELDVQSELGKGTTIRMKKTIYSAIHIS